MHQAPAVSNRKRASRQARKAPFRRKIGTRTISVQNLSQAPYAAAVVQHGPDGRERIRKCRTMREAIALAETWCADAENHGLTVAQSLTGAELALVAELKAELTAAGQTLVDAVAQIRDRLARSHRKLTVVEAAAEVIAEKESRGMSERYRATAKNQFKRITGEFGGRDVADVAAKELRQWIDRQPVTNATKNGLRTYALLLWNHAAATGATSSNPAAELARWKVVDAEDVAIFTVAEARALLDHAPAEIAPALAIGLFAGLRSEELHKLDWRRIHPGEIEVTAATAKSSRRRFVEVTENLAEWLAPYRQKSGPLIPNRGRFRRLWRETREAAGITDRRDNAMRHSFASYYYALTDDAAKVSAALGHRDTALVFRHYRSAVRKAGAEAYFNLRPPSATASNILPITSATA